MRGLLESLRVALAENGEVELAVRVEDALDGPDQELEDFLVSNSLWGGSGSIADQAGLPRSEARSIIETALIELGEQQLETGVVNPRTAMWVEAFRKWRDQGI